MHIAILGFGLIGGSVARALGRSGARPGGEPWVVSAWSPSRVGPALALADGVVDVAAASVEAALDGAELVVLAAPAPIVLGQLDDLAGAWRAALAPDAVITDVASTKGQIVERATALGLRFVGGHPMAGRETSGYAASTEDLFDERPWVVVPTDDRAALDRVERLIHATGARSVAMTARAHDEAVAAISHLPLVVAAALVEAVAGRAPRATRDDWPAAARLAASGWRDMTRLARGEVDMGAGILATNGPAVAARVRDLITVLEDWLTELEPIDGPALVDIATRLADARDTLEATSR
ncbi:MAG TPA: prephenate dehydrogenase/arogenate dehydrogenase family protein [Candidatus Limnocylindrales bacterium]|nr:prephenate dehydrogenase/arogenate dehydrogenase family protein [Candidatus Limnocylindrales bacterium]